MNKVSHIKGWADKRIEAIQRVSKRKGFRFDDTNPYHAEWVSLLNSTANCKKQYKLERKKNAKNILVNTFNVIRNKLCV